MEKLKELVNDFYEYTKTISISEMELFENYYCKLSDSEIDYLNDRGTLDKNIERMVKQDILYDFVFNQEGIKQQIENDIDTYEKGSLEYKEIEKIQDKILEVFPDFKF